MNDQAECPTEPDVYQRLGLTTVINASAPLTVLGGSLMPPEVLTAMVQAAGAYVDMIELQDRVGQRLAELTQNEAAYVTCGAAAGIVLSVLGCRTGADPRRVALLPYDESLPDEVVMHAAHRIPYDRAVELAGARIMTAGTVLQTFEWELEAALGPRTAAILYVAGDHLRRGVLSLDQTVRIAHDRGIPVIVDAAAQLPPPSNLWHYTTEQGADLAVFSGGKDLRGPQASGLIVGRATAIAACSVNGAPHQRLARAMKVGKEEVFGLLAAVELFLAQDHNALRKQAEHTVSEWCSRLTEIAGVSARREFPGEAARPIPRLRVDVDPNVAGVTISDIVDRLWHGRPRIAVLVERDGLYLSPENLASCEQTVVIDRLLHAIGG